MNRPKSSCRETAARRSTRDLGVVTFHRLSPSTTRVMVQIDWETETLAEKAGALVGADDMQVKKDLATFKEFIESRGVDEGGWRGDVQ